MVWLFLMIAGSFEILGVVLLNELSRTKNKIYVIFLGLAFILSFSTLKFAMVSIPMGTAYAIWTGIGPAGGTLIGMIFYRESTRLSRILCILLIIISVVGLRLISY